MNFESYHGKTFVIKYGGAAMINAELKKRFIEDIVLLRKSGVNIVIVHGGGNEITAVAKQLGMETTFIEGQRYTGKDMIGIVQMVLAGKTNKDIVAEYNLHGLHALGLCGIDCNLLRVKKFSKNGTDLGFVGIITSVNVSFLRMLMNEDILPVIAPLGTDENGNVYNINADNAASGIAQALHADKLIYVSDIDGVYARGRILRSLDRTYAERLIEEAEIDGGMIPKVRSAFHAMKNNVDSVVLINGKIKNSIAAQLSGTQIAGTEFVH